MASKGTRKAELVAWLAEPGQEVERGLSFIIDNNAPGVYAWIDHNFPGKYRKLMPGLENSEAIKVEMFQFLLRRASASGNPLQFVQTATQQIGVLANPNPLNWTKIID